MFIVGLVHIQDNDLRSIRYWSVEPAARL